MRCPRRGEIGAHVYSGDDKWRDDGTCSYCGSLSPDELFERIEQEHELIPTDKNYKVYIRAGGHQRKFYFQHLSDDEQQRFLDLLNARTLHIAYPGYFYRLPFFAVAKQ